MNQETSIFSAQIKNVITSRLKKLFPKSGSAVLVFDNEYNDEGYYSKVQRIKVYDKKGVRMFPTCEKTEEAVFELISEIYLDDDNNEYALQDMEIKY